MSDKVITCYVCGNEKFVHLFRKDGFNIVQCDACELVFVNSQVSDEETKGIYEQEYFDNRNALAETSERETVVKDFKTRSYQIYFQDILKHKSGGKFLDIGCAEGYFLRVAEENGFTTYGVEISDFAAQVARESTGGEIRTGSLRDAEYEDNFFDVVTLIDVVEHFHDPLIEMQEIYRILKPGGICFLFTPDYHSPASKLMGQRWFELKPPEHLFYFTTNTLETLLSKAGFKDIETKTEGKVLTLEFIATILENTNGLIARLMKVGLGWLPIYKKHIHFKSGFVIGTGCK